MPALLVQFNITLTKLIPLFFTFIMTRDYVIVKLAHIMIAGLGIKCTPRKHSISTDTTKRKCE